MSVPNKTREQAVSWLMDRLGGFLVNEVRIVRPDDVQGLKQQLLAAPGPEMPPDLERFINALFIDDALKPILHAEARRILRETPLSRHGYC
jgi:hypothetical protein